MKHFLFTSIAIFLFSIYYAQDQNWGQFTGNFQGDFQYYVQDSLIDAPSVPERFLMNSFANFNYSAGKFSAGFRYEGYLNTMLGFPNAGNINDGVGIPYRWAGFAADNFEITVGSFYEQFGNGLTLRTYEQKLLGIDNALDGIRIKFNPTSGIYLKGLVGKQRYYWEKGEGIVRGIDGEFHLNDIINKWKDNSLRLILGGSFVSKYQKDDNPIYVLPENIGAGAGRIAINYKGFNINSEYSYKINDPSADNNYIYKSGQALLINATYSQKGFGVLLGTKWVDNMSFRSERDAGLTDLSINQLPEITRNHVYSLTAYYPYATQPTGEWGMQAEVFYNFKRKTPIGGKYGTNVSVNYSRVQGITKTPINDTTPIGLAGTSGYTNTFFSIGDSLYFQDINLEINKRWGKNLKMLLMYQNLKYNYDILRGTNEKLIVNAHVAVIDLTYKFKSTIALRGEFQALFTDEDKGDWALATLEFNIPKWFINISDNWNYGNSNPDKRVHYFNTGVGYTSGASRIQLSYGRQREGITCVGGVCRAVPASNGVFLTISSTF
ncbi:MAG TPA: DUF6029 family protein [Bacteroidales bacterium]|nr:DUF6029 family protein [Bacteroidales bacterium]